MKCQNCGSTVQDDAMFCDQCGAKLDPGLTSAVQPPTAAITAAAPVTSMSAAAPGAANICPACGTENMPGEMFCTDCGTPLQAPVPESELKVAPATTAWEPEPAVTPLVEVAPAPEPVALVDQQSAVSVPLTCSACGAELEPGDQFCHACGARVTAPAVATSEPVVADAAVAPSATGTETVAAQPVAVTECPACGAHVNPGEAFCEFCGAALVVPQQQITAPVVMSTPAVTPVAEVSAVRGPVLVVAETGQVLPLAQGTEVLVGREDPFSNTYPEVDLTPFGAE
ncbi:MAG: zinc ribbon domain-containing protein, partial [Anaerolineae bacterium]